MEAAIRNTDGGGEVAHAAAVAGIVTVLFATLSDAWALWQRYTYLADQCDVITLRDEWLRGCETTAALSLHKGYSLSKRSMILGPVWNRLATIVRCIAYALLDETNLPFRLGFALSFLIVDLFVLRVLRSPSAVLRLSRSDWGLPFVNTINFINQAVPSPLACEAGYSGER